MTDEPQFIDFGFLRVITRDDFDRWVDRAYREGLKVGRRVDSLVWEALTTEVESIRPEQFVPDASTRHGPLLVPDDGGELLVRFARQQYDPRFVRVRIERVLPPGTQEAEEEAP